MRTVTALDIIEDVTKVAENTCLKEIKRKPSIFEVSFSLLRKMGLEGLDHRETRIERGFQHISHKV